MCNSMNENIKRITAGILGIMMLFVVMFSAFFLAAEVDHDCSGEDCPICACIEQCEQTLHSFAGGKVFLLIALLPLLLLVLFTADYSPVILRDTPISRKIRLNH